jgi:hypothetical protein
LGDVFEIFVVMEGMRDYVELHVTPNNKRLHVRLPGVGVRAFRVDEPLSSSEEGNARLRPAFAGRVSNGEERDFSFKLEYTNAGELTHSVSGLKVAGLSGIYHPQEMEFVTPLERHTMKLGAVDSWPAMASLAREKRISISRLTCYKEAEVAHMKTLSPHLLLLHDWPVAPPSIMQIYDRRPEAEMNKMQRTAATSAQESEKERADLLLDAVRWEAMRYRVQLERALLRVLGYIDRLAFDPQLDEGGERLCLYDIASQDIPGLRPAVIPKHIAAWHSKYVELEFSLMDQADEKAMIDAHIHELPSIHKETISAFDSFGDFLDNSNNIRS